MEHGSNHMLPEDLSYWILQVFDLAQNFGRIICLDRNPLRHDPTWAVLQK